MDAISFLQSNNVYLILALVLAVLLFLLLQYLIDYLFIGRNFNKYQKRKAQYPTQISFRKAQKYFKKFQTNKNYAEEQDNVIEFGSNRRAFPVPDQKPSLRERLRQRNNFQAKNILNVSEQRFFGLLCDNLNNCHVFPQVSFNALVTHASWINRDHWQKLVRSRFNAKYVDFVVCNRVDFKVIAVIEYDGPGHQSSHDEERDLLLRGAGYRVERFTQHDTPQSIRLRFGLADTVESAPIKNDLIPAIEKRDEFIVPDKRVSDIES